MQHHLKDQVNQVLFVYADGGGVEMKTEDEDEDEDEDGDPNKTQPTSFLNHSRRWEPERNIVGFPSTHSIAALCFISLGSVKKHQKMG